MVNCILPDHTSSKRGEESFQTMGWSLEPFHQDSPLHYRATILHCELTNSMSETIVNFV